LTCTTVVVSCDLIFDLHDGRVTTGVYRNMCLPGLVKICHIVLEIS